LFVSVPPFSQVGMGGVPTILLLGHSFIRRLKEDLSRAFDVRASLEFGLHGVANVHLHGVGGRTVAKLHTFDLGVVRQLKPDIVILEVGTNDLNNLQPEVVGSALEELVLTLKRQFAIEIICVCHVIPRGLSSASHPLQFWEKAKILKQYLEVVLGHIEGVFTWTHQAFSTPSKQLYLRDGVHVNAKGQYILYRSYRGAIFKALRYYQC